MALILFIVQIGSFLTALADLILPKHIVEDFDETLRDGLTSLQSCINVFSLYGEWWSAAKGFPWHGCFGAVIVLSLPLFGIAIPGIVQSYLMFSMGLVGLCIGISLLSLIGITLLACIKGFVHFLTCWPKGVIAALSSACFVVSTMAQFGGVQ